MRNITFEGVGASGKSTQSALLAKHLRDLGYNVLEVYEPAYTNAGKQIYQAILNNTLSQDVEMLLFMADRALTHGEINPMDIDFVISDRSFISSVVYQGIIGGLGVTEVVRAHELIYYTPIDLLIIMDVDHDTAAKRLNARGRYTLLDDRYINLFDKTRNAFLSVAEYDGWLFDQCIIVDASGSLESISEQIAEEVKKIL